MRGRTVTRGLVAVCVALATAAAAAPAPAPATAAQPWNLDLAIRYFPSAGYHSQYVTVLALGRTAWFFGGSNFAGKGTPEVEVHARRGWRPSFLPSGLRSWIAGASAVSASNIWAVTYLGGKVVRWNGEHWVKVAAGRWNNDAQFTGIVAISPGDVWLFGGRGWSAPGAGTWHWSGRKWTEVRGAPGRIYRASEASKSDLWGIGGTPGNMTELWRHRRSGWYQVSPARLAGFSYSAVLAINPDDVWVAGSQSGIPMLGHYNGQGWTAISTPALVPPTAICRDGRGGIWVIANSGFGPSSAYDRGSHGNWTTAPVGRTSADEVLGCAAIPGTTSAWGAGKSQAPAGTAAAVYGYGKVPADYLRSARSSLGPDGYFPASKHPGG